MLEQVFRFQRTDQQVLEDIVEAPDARRLQITHGVFSPGQSSPYLKTLADIHLIVVRGALALRLADQTIHTYEAGNVVAVPFGAMMEIRSTGQDALEFFEIKTPHPEAWRFKDAG